MLLKIEKQLLKQKYLEENNYTTYNIQVIVPKKWGLVYIDEMLDGIIRMIDSRIIQNWIK